MATLARRLRQRLGMTSMFMLWLVGTLCGSGCGAPALAQRNYNPLPPQVAFINDGKYSGTLLIEGKTLPITGTLNFLSGVTEYLKISVDLDIEGQQITSNSFLVETPTVINEWEIPVSTFPTTCLKEVFSGASLPQCNAWSRNAQGVYFQKCTVSAQGKQATLDSMVVLSADNKLVSLSEIDMTNSNSINITIGHQGTDQGSSPPPLSDFNRPSICNAPNSNDQVENNNSPGNEVGPVCTGTIHPANICF